MLIFARGWTPIPPNSPRPIEPQVWPPPSGALCLLSGASGRRINLAPLLAAQQGGARAQGCPASSGLGFLREMPFFYPKIGFSIRQFTA